MAQRPLTEETDPTKASDAQKIALYIANLLLAKNALGNVSISNGNRPVTAGDLVQFDGSTGLKIKDSGYKATDFLTQATADGRFQRNARRVLNGETRTIAAWTSEVIVGPFEVDDGGTVVIADEGILLIH